MPKPTVAELTCLRDPDEPEGPVWWVGEWGLDGESVGYSHSSDDLREIIDVVLEDAREWAAQGHQTVITWRTRGDDELDVDDELDALDLELPTTTATPE